MGQRVVRVNELIKREISHFLHTRYRQETVTITVTEVQCTTDFREARVYYSVLGDEEAQADAGRFFTRQRDEIRRHVGRVVRLRNTPRLIYALDDSIARGVRLNTLIDSLSVPETQPEPPDPDGRKPSIPD